MSSPSSSRVSFLSSIVDRQKSVVQSSDAPRRAAVNVALAAAVAADISQGGVVAGAIGGGRGHDFFVLLEYLLLLLTAANAIHAAFSHFFPHFGQSEIVLSASQMNLMHIDEKRHAGFKMSPKEKEKPKYPNPFSPLRGNFLLAASNNNSPVMGDASSASWVYQGGSNAPSPSGQSPADASVASVSPRFNSSINSSIVDERILDEYLDEYDTWERHNGSSLNTSFDLQQQQQQNQSLQQQTNMSSGGLSFWKSPTDLNRSQQDYSPILKTLSYSLSTPMPGSRGVDGDETKSASLMRRGGGGGDHSLCFRIGIDPLELVSWMQNLRMWISQTVLVRLVAEIDDANRQLKRLGMSDALVGEAGLEKVKKTASAGAHMVPQKLAQQLHNIVPFLEVTLSQDYLVHRVRELAKGGAMSGFRWNGGGSFRGHEWTDKLPTDSELVMHCVASYFDSRLPPAKGVVDGHTFTSLHFFKLPEDKAELAKSKTPIAVVRTTLKPPHYILQVDGGEGKKLELEPGRNNLFHTLLLFLHQIKTKESGMLGKVNLGRSGINILWVIEEEG